MADDSTFSQRIKGDCEDLALITLLPSAAARMGAADPRRMVVSGTRASTGNILCSWVGNFSLFFCQSSLRREERFKLVNGIGGGHRGHAWEGVGGGGGERDDARTMASF